MLFLASSPPATFSQEMADAPAADGMLVDVLPLSFVNETSGMLMTPVLDLANQDAVAMLQEIIKNQSSSCICTTSGYSGMVFADNGTIMAYGNTSFVECNRHNMTHEGMDEADGTDYCYVLGGTECIDATPSILGDTYAAFTMAAWRPCNQFEVKGFFGGLFRRNKNKNMEWSFNAVGGSSATKDNQWGNQENQGNQGNQWGNQGNQWGNQGNQWGNPGNPWGNPGNQWGNQGK